MSVDSRFSSVELNDGYNITLKMDSDGDVFVKVSHDETDWEKRIKRWVTGTDYWPVKMLPKVIKKAMKKIKKHQNSPKIIPISPEQQFELCVAALRETYSD